MTGLDTNVVVRLLVQDDAKQVRRVRRAIANECAEDDPGLINSIVLVETVWVLGSVYGYRREEIARAVEALLQVREIEVQCKNEVWEALALFRGGADFSDCYLAAINRGIGCNHTLTLDKRAACLELFRAV